MKRILFVDDEPNLLDGLRRLLRSMRHEWSMEFAGCGIDALALLEKEPVDVVVTDMRMPGMDGAELLSRVRDRFPHIVRIVLSGQADREAVLRSVGVTHQHLTKPCDADALKATVTRACSLHDLLANEALQRVVSSLHTVPSLPSLYIEVMEELRSGDPSTQKVGEIISKDPGMASKILQMVNSSFFGIRRHVSTPAQAVALLGTETVKSLVLGAQVFAQFDGELAREMSVDSICTHSQRTGFLARSIAQSQQADAKAGDNALLAGLLHDVGRLVLAAHFSETYFAAVTLAKREKLPLPDAERQLFGATHTEVGAYLLGLWGLPDPVVEAVAWHHRPRECPCDLFCPLTAVHVANALDHESSTAELGCSATEIDGEYLERIQLTDRLPAWREIVRATSEEAGT